MILTIAALKGNQIKKGKSIMFKRQSLKWNQIIWKRTLVLIFKVLKMQLRTSKVVKTNIHKKNSKE